jgi:hypothetical protein
MPQNSKCIIDLRVSWRWITMSRFVSVLELELGRDWFRLLLQSSIEAFWNFSMRRFFNIKPWFEHDVNHRKKEKEIQRNQSNFEMYWNGRPTQ